MRNDYKFIKTIKIPKDLETRENRFYTSMPKILLGRVEPSEWTKKVEELNAIFKDGDGWSLINILRICIPFFALFSGFTYKKQVQKFINNWNEELGNVGIKIADVTEYAYGEMVIYIYSK